MNGIQEELNRLRSDYEYKMATQPSHTRPEIYKRINDEYRIKADRLTEQYIRNEEFANEKVTHSVEEPSRRQRRKKLASLIKVDC